MSVPGAFSSDANVESKSIDVTPEVQDDVINRTARSNHSQFRLAVDLATDNDQIVDKAIFAKDTFSMSITYVVD